MDINDIIKDQKYFNEIKEYTYVTNKELTTIPLGSYIKFIDRNEIFKTGGFLVKYIENRDITKSYFILKSNKIYKLYCYYYWVFYKTVKKKSKRDIFINLLNNI
jgi:hypothetical protein